MSRFLRHSRALALAAVAAMPAFAADLTVGGRTEVWYDDNVLGTDKDAISDFEVLIAPTAALSEDWGTVEATLDLKPAYELFVDQTGLRGWSYQADSSLAWNPSARTTISLQDTFLSDRNLRLLTNTGQPGGTPAEAGAQDRFLRNIAQLGAQYRLTPVDRLAFGASYALWRFDDASRVDQDTYSVNTRYEHSLTRTVSLGGSASFSRLDLQPTPFRPAHHTNYTNVSLVANYEPKDTFLIRASIGPTYIRQQVPSLQRFQLMTFVGGFARVGLIPSTCPTLPTGEFFEGPSCNYGFLGFFPNAYLLETIPVQGGDRDDLTYFAEITAERRWNAGSLVVSYDRDEGSNSSVGFSSIADTFELRGSYQPLRELTLSAAAIWESRKETQTTDQFVTILDTLPGGPGLPAINKLVPVARRAVNGRLINEYVDSITAYLSANYRLSRRARLDAAFSWRDQSASALSSFDDYKRIQIMLGLTVELEPTRW